MTTRDIGGTFALGIHRIRSPRETCELAREALARLEPPIMAGVEEVERASGIPQYRILGTERFQALTTAKGTNGKGHTRDHALASGLMEMAERYSCWRYLLERQGVRACSSRDLGDNPYGVGDIFASFVDDSGVRVMSDDELESAEMSWVQASTLDGGFAWLPAGVVHVFEGTNGMASGNSAQEAALHALCELVERHCLTLIEALHLATPRVDPTTIDSPIAMGLIARFEGLGQKVIVKDFSLDTGLPVFGAVRDLGDGTCEMTAGVASSREEALARTLTENSQSERGEGWFRREDIPHLFADGGTCSYAEMADLGDRDLGVELGRIRDRLAERGMRPYVMDTTQADLGVPAATVVIVGAKFHAPRNIDHSIVTALVDDALRSGRFATAHRYLDLGVERDPRRLQMYR
jgi:ribosomal protein S12 methylthiotransferase accessory factor